MVYKIGSARIDENGNICGGKPGDQTGREVAIENFYMHPQGWYCFRPKDPQKAELMAKEMTDACNNPNIGYAQYGNKTNTSRMGVVYAITKYKHMKDIAEPTNGDCGTLVRADIMAAGMGDPGGFSTKTEASVLLKTGQFEKPFAVRSNSLLCNGDVLVTKTKGHTAIVVQGEPRIKKPTSTEAPASSKKLNKKPQFEMVLTGDLHARTGPGTTYPLLKSYPSLKKGGKEQIWFCDTTHTNYNEKGGAWHYVKIIGDKGNKYGFMSARYLKKKAK